MNHLSFSCSSSRTSSLVCALGVLAGLACNNTLKPVTRAGSGGIAGERAGTGGAGPGLGLPDGGGVDVGPAGSSACVTENHAVEPGAAELLFLVDVSWDMGQPWVGMMTKREAAKLALFDFINDGKSAKLSVGLSYFPYGYLDKPCLEWDDCGHEKELIAGGTHHIEVCIQRGRVCQINGQPPGTYEKCDGGLGLSGGLCGCDVSRDICPGKMNSTCVAPGNCSVSHKMCPEVGKPCPGAEGMCEAVWGKCFISGTSCNPKLYEKLRVPFAELPAGAKPLLDAVDLGELQSGPTMPLAAGVRGSLVALGKRMAEQPGRPRALVLVTAAALKEVPQQCPPTDPLLAKPDLEAAYKAAQSIPTYVIGVLNKDGMVEKDIVNQLAAAGGTEKAFVLDGSTDVAMGLHEALGKIRSATVACDFALPMPKTSDTLDVRKVNVSVKTASGKLDLAYVGKAESCNDAQGKGQGRGKDGWYYDVDPAQGQPKRMVLCAATCTALRQDAASSVDVAFGCQSRLE
jgi:hypothetical protein